MLTKEELETISFMLQLAWDREYDSDYQDKKLMGEIQDMKQRINQHISEVFPVKE